MPSLKLNADDLRKEILGAADDAHQRVESAYVRAQEAIAEVERALNALPSSAIELINGSDIALVREIEQGYIGNNDARLELVVNGGHFDLGGAVLMPRGRYRVVLLATRLEDKA